MSAYTDLLRELTVSARAYLDPRPEARTNHYESTEVSCVCGFVSEAEDYEAACRSLRRHINRYHKIEADARKAAVTRFTDALAAAEVALAKEKENQCTE